MRNQRRLNIMMVAKIDAYIKQSEVKIIEIEVPIIEKIISYIIVDGRSGLSIMPF